MRRTYGRAQKLKSRTTIERLFVQGERLKTFPFLLIFEKFDHKGPNPVKAGFSVPKKNIKSAVGRNRIKRMMKEAFRTNFPEMLYRLPDQYVFMILYIPSKELEYHKIEKGMNTLLETFLTKTGNNETKN